MVSLKWGDVLSTLLPGALALFAVASWFPLLNDRMKNLEKVGVAEGFALLIAAGLLGGALEAFTRVIWERYWLIRRCRPADVLGNLDASNLDLYERGVQSSYKYATFYANFAWATVLLLVARWHSGNKLCSYSSFILAVLIGLLLVASDLQWRYYVNYQTKVLGGNKDAGKRSAAGDTSTIPAGGEKSGKG